MRTIPCRGCGAPIGFIQVEGRSGWMPVNADLIKTCLRPTRALGLRELALITERGRFLRGYETSLTDAEGEAVEGWEPHWGACTAREQFRRSGNARKPT